MFLKRTKKRIEELEQELKYADATIRKVREEKKQLELVISGEKTCVPGRYCKKCKYGIEPSGFEAWSCGKEVVCPEFEMNTVKLEKVVGADVYI